MIVGSTFDATAQARNVSAGYILLSFLCYINLALDAGSLADPQQYLAPHTSLIMLPYPKELLHSSSCLRFAYS